MNVNPIISIVIPMYNSREYIEECLTSIMQQTIQGFEVIVVDDGSNDGSEYIAENFARNCDYIRVIHQKNAGVIKARKVGAQQAVGQYILNVDSDDFLLPTHLESIMAEIKHRKSDVIVTGYTDYLNGKTTQRMQNIQCGYYEREEILQNIIPRLMSCGKFYEFGIYPTLWTTCIRKEILIECQRTLDERYSIGDDISVTYPVILKANSLSIINETSYMYRIRNDSITHVFDKQFSERIIYLFSYLEKVLPTQTLLEKQFADYVVFETCILVSNYLGHGLEELSYSKSIEHIRFVLENRIVKQAFKKFCILRRHVPLKWRIKTFLIKQKWFRVYKYIIK